MTTEPVDFDDPELDVAGLRDAELAEAGLADAGLPDAGLVDAGLDDPGLDDPELFGSIDAEEPPIEVIEAFDGRRGVFLLAGEPGSVRRDAIEHKWHTVTLDTVDVTDQVGFVASMADAFDFPELVGGTWDLLDQHLRALDLDEPNGLLITWEGWAPFAETDVDSFEMALEVFQDACIAWEYDEFQAAVLLVGAGPETDLPSW